MSNIRTSIWSVVLILAILVVFAFAQSSTALSGRLPSPDDSSLPADPLLSSENYEVPWDVLANGGGIVFSDSFQLHHTIGQPGIGTMRSESFILNAGFWQMIQDKLFLPFIVR